MYYFQRNISDYRAATAHLSLLEHGAYCWLMDTYYLNESPLTLDERALFRQSMAKSDEEKQAVIDVLNEFFTKTEHGWVNKRCEIEIQAYVSNAEKNRANGKKGGRPKKPIETENNPVGFFGYPKDNPNETQTKGNQETINQETQNTEHKEKQGAKAPAKKTPKPAFVLPDWFAESDVKNWHAWNSTAKRRNATHAQLSAAIDKLSKWRDAGVDWQKALDNSAVGGWQGLFEPKIDGSVGGGQRGIFNKAQAIQDANNAVVAQMFGGE